MTTDNSDYERQRRQADQLWQSVTEDHARSRTQSLEDRVADLERLVKQLMDWKLSRLWNERD
jgi:hypothetical protein